MPRKPDRTEEGSLARIWVAMPLGRLPSSEVTVDDGSVVKTLLRAGPAAR